MFNYSNSGYSLSDIAAATGGYDRNGGNGGWGNDAWWIIVLLLFGWGRNGFGSFGGGGEVPSASITTTTTNDIQRGFDQSAVMNTLGNIGAALNNGFSDAAVSQCNQTTTLLTGLNAIQSQIANSGYDTISSINNGVNGLTGILMSNEMARQQCCCDTKQAIADLKYTIATENCADRAAINNALRDVIANQTAGIQIIVDKLCQQEIDALKTQNANLQTQINLANLAASQNAQTSRLLQDNAAQTAALLQGINPAPIPAYVVQNPNCCTPNYSCGCGCAA